MFWRIDDFQFFDIVFRLLNDRSSHRWCHSSSFLVVIRLRKAFLSLSSFKFYFNLVWFYWISVSQSLVFSHKMNIFQNTWSCGPTHWQFFKSGFGLGKGSSLWVHSLFWFYVVSSLCDYHYTTLILIRFFFFFLNPFVIFAMFLGGKIANIKDLHLSNSDESIYFFSSHMRLLCIVQNIQNCCKQSITSEISQSFGSPANLIHTSWILNDDIMKQRASKHQHRASTHSRCHWNGLNLCPPSSPNIYKPPRQFKVQVYSEQLTSKSSMTQ